MICPEENRMKRIMLSATVALVPSMDSAAAQSNSRCPTANFAAAGASITGVQNQAMTELGFDIRKTSQPGGPSWIPLRCRSSSLQLGSDRRKFLLCPLSADAADRGRERLDPAARHGRRAGHPGRFTDQSPIDRVRRRLGPGPDEFGLALLDNITINGVYVGRGSVNAK